MASMTTTLQGVPVWAEHGPGAIVDDNGGFLGTGASVALAAHPSEPGVIYVANSGGGVWRTRDAVPGHASPSWAPVTEQHPSPAMGAVAISPLDANTVFAGTGSAFASFGPSGRSVGLYRTTDGGDTWKDVGGAQLTGISVRSLLPTSLSEAAGQVVLVAGLSEASPGKPGGILRSEDGGQTFTLQSGAAAGKGLPDGDGWALVEDSKQAGHVYAAVGGPTPGIFWSTDAGKTSWSPVAAGIDTTQLSTAQWIRLAIRSDPGGGPSTLCAGIVNSGQPVGFYRSPATQGLEQWTSIALPAGGAAAIEPYSQAVWKFALAIEPLTGDIYVGGDEAGGVWRCRLADPSNPQWEKISKSLDFAGADLAQDPDKVPHADIQDLVFDAAGNLLTACDGGVYRLPNPSNRPGGAQRKWTAIGAAIRNNEAFSVALDTLNNILTVASADNGTSVQRRSGSQEWTLTLWGDGAAQAVNNDADSVSWRYSEDGALNSFMRWKVDKDNNATAEAVLLASSATPNVLGSGLNAVDRKQVMNPDGTPDLNPDGSPKYTYNSGTYVLNNVPDERSKAGRPSRMMVGSSGLYESTDGGATIAEITVTDPSTNAAVTGVHSIAYGANDGGAPRPEVAYVGMGAGLWLRGPQGGAFAQVSAYKGGQVIGVAVDVSDWKRAYVVDSAHVYRTDKGGQSWTECTGNLLRMTADPQGNLGSVIVHRSDAGDEVVLVGAAGGLFRCLNPGDGPGAMWTKFGLNLPGGCQGNDLHFYPGQKRDNGVAGDVLVASNYGRGIWTLPNASSMLFQPSILRITGTAREQYIRFVRNPDVPAHLDVHAPDGAGPTLTLPLASIEQIIVDCEGGFNTLTLDSTNGPIYVPHGIRYSAGGSDNRLVLSGGGVTSQVFRIAGGTTGSVTVGDMSAFYSGIAEIEGTVRAAHTVVETVTPPDGLHVSNGTAVGHLQTVQILQRRGGAQLNLKLSNTAELTLDVTRGGGRVVVDELLAAPARLRKLIVLTGRSGHDIRVTSTPPRVELEIRGAGGQDSVAIGTLTGSGGLLDGVRGPIHLTNAGGKTALSVSDAENPRTTTADLNERSVSGLAPAPITFEPGALSGLTVLGSKDGTAFTVGATGTFPTTVLGVGSVNRLDVHATTGSLDYTTGSGVDNVHLGAPGAGGAVLAGVTGAVRLHCSPAGNLAVTLDDSGDSQPRDVGITDHAITGLAPAEIDVFPGGNQFLNGLTVLGGKARMFYSIVDTPPMFTVGLHGQGTDVVNVYRTRQDFSVDGAAAVTVGSANLGLATIQGAVRVGGGASTALTVDDSGTAAARNFTMDASAITGLTSSPIGFGAATLHSLSVRCGGGGNAVVVAATVAGATTQLELGQGPDQVNVRATSAPLAINGRAGALHQVLVGSTPDFRKADLGSISGEVRVTAHSDTVDLVVSDAAGKLPRRAEMDAADITALAPAGIRFGPLHSLEVHLSRAGNVLGVTGTNPGGPVTVHTGGRDTVEVKTSLRSPCSLLVEGPTPPASDALRVLLGDPAQQVTHTPPAGSSPGTIRVTFPNGSTSVIEYRQIPTVRTP
ncbi:MAG: hypothetical protein M3075_06785 [Candidatus Dormibacteraeota bacterium]|nr:hypothetical protein [Candidatus Dormibacteraeota bacterium]